ncbi:MAG: hypothetical protein CHACPFDD_00442 [Phycisphaerae bacterium]|nr:hypothetical protein [Phycisphaerae bacterium]
MTGQVAAAYDAFRKQVIVVSGTGDGIIYAYDDSGWSQLGMVLQIAHPAMAAIGNSHASAYLFGGCARGQIEYQVSPFDPLGGSAFFDSSHVPWTGGAPIAGPCPR